MRILFVTSNRIGDAVLNSGVLAALLAEHPQARFTIAAGAASAPLFEAFPNLDRLLIMHKKRSRGLHWFHLWRQTAFCWWDIVVDMRRSAIGWIVPRSTLYRVPLPRTAVHRVVLAASAIGRADAPPTPVVWTTEEDDAVARSTLGETAPVIVIGPTANWQGKIWPAERFSALVQRLLAADGLAGQAKIAVVAAPAERGMAEPVLAAIPEDRRIDLIGLTLSQIAACLKQSTAYIGNDSGLMHLAAAAGAPTLGLFGPSKTELYAPWGPHTDFVRTRESYDELINAPGYDRHTTGTLMGSITVDQVYDRLTVLLDRTSVAEEG